MSYGQGFVTDWYILEKGAMVNTIKPGVNDLTLQLAKTNNKQLDRAAVDTMLARVHYNAGCIVLVYAVVNGSYLATDMEGRNLVIKGNVTKVQHGIGSKVGYVKQTVTSDGVTLPQANYVWIKEQKEGEKSLTIQTWGKHMLNIEADKVYDVSQLMIEMADPSKYKVVK